MNSNYIYLEAPNYLPINELRRNGDLVFLGGSITGAANWQIEAKNKLIEHFNVINPRRADFDISNPNAEREQINWEFNYLNQCDIILFFFSNETLAPITLLELGAMLERTKFAIWQKLYIGIHPEYKRKNDVIIQTELRNPVFARNIFMDLDEMLEMIIGENK
jgi:hypothetical protein